MLTCLRVRSFAIIEALEVELDTGLNIVTGETGAGKSILVDALQLVLGARGRPDVVRTDAEAAEVEALFELRDEPEVLSALREQGVETDGESRERDRPHTGLYQWAARHARPAQGGHQRARRHLVAARVPLAGRSATSSDLSRCIREPLGARRKRGAGACGARRGGGAARGSRH
ncbi:MAG: hypothetical protein EP303_02670 [Deltaproteobacteria bacterium]|nr:MAG: hypothetical protein EP303_02670 [Deltaproteobacteria bacterium]